MARRLKQVETSKEQTSEEIEQLREKEDEMEVQLAVMQQSINTVSNVLFSCALQSLTILRREKLESHLRFGRCPVCAAGQLYRERLPGFGTCLHWDKETFKSCSARAHSTN